MKHFAIHVLHLASENTKAFLHIGQASLDYGRFIRVIIQKKLVVVRRFCPVLAILHLNPHQGIDFTVRNNQYKIRVFLISLSSNSLHWMTKTDQNLSVIPSEN